MFIEKWKIKKMVKSFNKKIEKTRSYKNIITRSLDIDKYKLLFYIVISISFYFI